MTVKNIAKTVKHLKNNNGSWTYRRRVPERHHKTLGIKMWNRPCGDVPYQHAVTMVTNWTEEDNALIAALDNPTVAKEVRWTTETATWAPYVERLIDSAKVLKEDPHALSRVMDEDGNEHLLDLEPYNSLQEAKDSITSIDADATLDDAERLVRYQNVLKVCFGAHIDLPSDLDDRDDFELVKRKLERRIADLAGDPNTISVVAERYYGHNGIRTGGLRKYRGSIRKLTDHMGDVPIKHVTAVDLRRFRDQQAAIMLDIIGEKFDYTVTTLIGHSLSYRDQLIVKIAQIQYSMRFHTSAHCAEMQCHSRTKSPYLQLILVREQHISELLCNAKPLLARQVK